MLDSRAATGFSGFKLNPFPETISVQPENTTGTITQAISDGQAMGQGLANGVHNAILHQNPANKPCE